MLTAVDRSAKGTMVIMHEVALLRAEILALRKANEGSVRDGEPKKKKRKEKKKKKENRIRLGGSLTVQEAQDLRDQKAIEEQVAQETQQSSRSAGEPCPRIRCCGVCGKSGHNTHMYEETAESFDPSVSDSVVVIS